MTLPTFLGIGVQRSGTTWLHAVLASHPDIYMPTRRKEIRFFDRYYDRGIDWYQKFFYPPEQTDRYLAIGEISTQYYDGAECPKRIFETLPDVKLIIILRHPVNRAYSHYGFSVQRGNYRGTFEEFVAARPSTLEKGYYSRYLKDYLRHFSRTRILALLFEEMFTDTLVTQDTLADFLGVASDKFPPSTTREKINASSIPRFQSLYGFMVKRGRQFRRHNFERTVDFVKRLGVDRVMAKGRCLPPLDQNLKKQLSQLYQQEFVELEQCLQTDLSCWRN